jgi:glycosyltransferase involved in cell wall biosynthesis
VDVERFSLVEEKGDYYFTASRMVPYKKIDLIVEAFSQMPDKRLVVIGDGPDFAKIKKIAGKNVQLMGYQPVSVLKEHMQKAKAFIFAAKEDFGIVPLEAQACGTPVIGFGKGALIETVRGLEEPEPTGVFFNEQTVDALRGAVEQFEERRNEITAVNCRNNALRFSPDRFRENFRKFVESCV